MKTTHRSVKRNGCATTHPLPLPPSSPPIRRMPCWWKCRFHASALEMPRVAPSLRQSQTNRAKPDKLGPLDRPPVPWSGQVPAKAPEKRTYNPQAHKHIDAQTDTQTQTHRRRHRDTDTETQTHRRRQTQTDTQRRTKTDTDTDMVVATHL